MDYLSRANDLIDLIGKISPTSLHAPNNNHFQYAAILPATTSNMKVMPFSACQQMTLFAMRNMSIAMGA